MDFFTDSRSQWIGYGDAPDAPYFQTTFRCSDVKGVKCAISGLGWNELYINGKKVGDRVLDPIVSIFDRHARYVVFDLEKYLKKGENTVSAVLGNGWYNCQTQEVWQFVMASWRHHPKLRLEIRKCKDLLLGTDSKWKVTHGPIIFNALRNGEFYDARRELPGWPGKCDTKNWAVAEITAPPGGLMEEQTCTPCRVISTTELKNPNIVGVYDLKRNISGHCRISVSGRAGALVKLDYRDRITDDGELSSAYQDTFVRGGEFQHDEYTLKGGGVEVWEPKFTYHGFQYVQLKYDSDDVKLVKLEAREVGTCFKTIGDIETSSDTVNRLLELTRQSYRANFVGIPTDCPHREKNGWTGDAQIASETGLYNFDAASAYNQWMATARDCQRPDGALPGIVPSSGWGFNWGSGPCWDCFFFVIPRNIYLYTGDDSALRANLSGMERYIDRVEIQSIGHIVQWGLGDWCPPDNKKMVDSKFSCTAEYYGCIRILAETEKHFGFASKAAKYSKLAEDVKNAINGAWYKGKGVYADGGQTAMATALYLGFCADGEEKAVLNALVRRVKKDKCRAQFGILGAKYVPRVLADNGYSDLAFEVLTQKEYPGWGNWVERGATSLWEMWNGTGSRNHIMFGDIGAWFHRYAAGFRHLEKTPGWKHIAVEPRALKGLSFCNAGYRGYLCSWTFKNGVFSGTLTVPEGSTAALTLPDGTKKLCRTGKHIFKCKA